MKDLVSVIVPIYKVEKYIKECLDSIIHQTYQKLEIILVDDGSPDNCGKICDEYAIKDNRIKVIHQDNKGLSAARNAGLDICTGEYVSFIDSDDVVHEDFIKALYYAIKEKNDDMSVCDFVNFKELTDINPDIGPVSFKQYTGNDFLKMLNNEMCGYAVVAWNKLYRKELFSSIRFPIGKINEDAFTTYKLFTQTNRICAISTKLYYYRQNPNSIMRKKFNVKRFDLIEGLEERMLYYLLNGYRDLYYGTVIVCLEKLRDFYYQTKKNSSE